MKHICSQKGNTFVMAVMVLVIGMVVGITLITLSVNGTTRNEHREQSNQAAVLAEDGVKHISLQINKELEQAIQELENEEKEEAEDEDLKFMDDHTYKEKYNEEFTAILNQYSCTKGTPITYEKEGKKYSVCYDDENTNNQIIDDTFRLVHFKSTATADGTTRTMISGVKIGAIYTNYPKALNYAVSTTEGGNLLMSGGISINGDVRAGGNIILSKTGFNPFEIIKNPWISSIYPSVGGKTVFPSKTGYPRFYFNSENGNLFLVKDEKLRSIFKYHDIYKTDYNKDNYNTKLFTLIPAQETENYLYNNDQLDFIKEAGAIESLNISRMVGIGKKIMKQKVIRDKYVDFDKDFLGVPLPLNGSYHAAEPTLIKAGVIASTEKAPLVTGDYKFAGAGGINVALSPYTFDGNFYFHDTQANLTAGSKVTLKGNYYFDQKDKGIDATPIVISGGGENLLDGNFYIDGKGKDALVIMNGSHKLRGNYFLNGDLVLYDTTIRSDAVFFVDGDVKISFSTLKKFDEGNLVIFATGDIDIDYGYDIGSNLFEKYMNVKQRDFNAFLYSAKKVEIHGSVSNLKLNGGVSGKNVFLTGIRGDVEKTILGLKYDSAEEQESKPSRLTIDYSNNIVTTFHKLNNLGFDFHDLDLQQPEIVTREFK